MKYRKRPPTVEAFQLTHDDMFSSSGWPEWAIKCWKSAAGGPMNYISPSEFMKDRYFTVNTLAGPCPAYEGDYILLGHYPDGVEFLSVSGKDQFESEWEVEAK